MSFEIDLNSNLNFIGNFNRPYLKIRPVCVAMYENRELSNRFPNLKRDLELMIAICDYERGRYGSSFSLSKNIICMYKDDPERTMIACSVAALSSAHLYGPHTVGLYARRAIRLQEWLEYKRC